MSEITIFLGPTLDRTSARSILNATFAPPVKRGDLDKLGEHVKVVGIVDGEFYQSLAVSPKEVLKLLDRDITVFGAASIGALRAAETYAYGTIGIGEIFRMYRDGDVDCDDEVAVCYDAETFQPTSEPLVNIRWTLQVARSQGLVEDAVVRDIIELMKKIYFPYRSYHKVVQICPQLKEFLGDAPPNLKRDDAQLLLSEIAGRISG